MAQTKATKKFEKNHLKDTLKRRKEFAKIKQKKQLKEKRKARRAKENEQDGDEDAEVDEVDRTSDRKSKAAFADMSVDEFFQGGFDIPELPGRANKGKASRKRKHTEVDEEEDEAQEDGFAEESSDEASDNEMEDHKQQLDALAKTDPEFYKHLQENDPELLDFADDHELGGIQLTESDDEPPKSKKQKTEKKGKGDEEDWTAVASSNEVTMEMIERWHKGMTEKQSLRQMREVIMAFRAAVRSNEDDEREYKYSISNPDGMRPVIAFQLSANS
jgi:nucleolar complex protein 2